MHHVVKNRAGFVNNGEIMKSRALVLGLLAAGITGVAQADEQGFYAGSGAGMYYVDLEGVDFDETAPTLRLFGGFQLNDYVSFEAGYTNLFEATSEIEGVDVDLDGSTWDVRVQPSLPLSDNFTAFAVLGWTSYDFEVSASEGGLTVSASDSDDDLMYGVGGQFMVNDVWNVRGEWTLVDVSDGDFGMFSVAAVYNFR